jgi:hypothetical protein
MSRKNKCDRSNCHVRTFTWRSERKKKADGSRCARLPEAELSLRLKKLAQRDLPDLWEPRAGRFFRWKTSRSRHRQNWICEK